MKKNPYATIRALLAFMPFKDMATTDLLKATPRPQAEAVYAARLVLEEERNDIPPLVEPVARETAPLTPNQIILAKMRAMKPNQS